MGERSTALRKKSTSDSRSRKDSVISKDESMERSNMEKSDMQEKLAAEKMKKTE